MTDFIWFLACGVVFFVGVTVGHLATNRAWIRALNKRKEK